MATECEIGINAGLDGGEPEFRKPPDHGLRKGLVHEVHERRAAPEGEPRAEPVGGVGRIAGGERAASLLDKTLEAEEVDGVGIHARRVPAGSCHQHVGGERPAKTRNERRERVRCRLWRIVAPQLVDQLVTRDDFVGPQQQQCKQPALPDAPEGECPVREMSFKRAEQTKLERPFSRHPPVIRLSSPAQILASKDEPGNLKGDRWTVIR